MLPRERRPPNYAQKETQLAALCSATDTICDAWESALAALNAVGFVGGTEMVRVSGGSMSNPTETAALNGDIAAEWLQDAKRFLWLLLSLPATSGNIRWTGPFYPPRLHAPLRRAAENAIELWPKNIAVLIERIHRLANTARAEWPPTPKFGQVIDGVKVGEHMNQVETCHECGGPVAGTAADPIRRVEGRPYHKAPCYDTVRQRAYRRSTLSHSPTSEKTASD